MATGNDTPLAPSGATARRALFGGAAAVGAAIAGVSSCQVVPAAVGADAELVALCAAWRQAMDRNAAVVDRLARMHECDWSEEDHAEWDETGEALSEIEDRVFEAKAANLAGIRAKAGVLEYMAAAFGIPAQPEQAASLVADVLAFGGAA